ncbi:MAG: dihydrodipicolinate synthase family protein [Methylococcaceae bacterium]|nr:dihydrodipicolinate synthase family protein [Methylococcaceae bacterium]
MVNLRGPIVALLTPFDASGEIEWQAFKTYLSALFSWGVRAVIANGTTGEFPSMTLNERQKIVEFVRQKNFQGTIINNVSATCVSDVRDLIAGTQGCADAVLLLPPYYYSACRNDGLCRFFVSTLSGTSLPAMLYNFPQHTGNRLNADLVAMLLDKGIAVQGIKDSSGDTDNAMVYKSNFPKVKIFLGNDTKVLEVLQKGLSGSVTGGANPLPELLIAMQTDFQLSGDKAHSLQRCLDVWNEFREASGYFEIPLVKVAMGARIADFPLHVRAPFTPVPAEEIDRIKTIVICAQENIKNNKYKFLKD